jgi:sugar phosphate isomerase/epimerase
VILGYCTNIHPGESWAEVRANLETHVAAVKARFAPDAPLPIGLRLSARAARELEPEAPALAAWLAARGMYVYTINGFPYGAFHATRVKEAVYRPDWLEDDRLDYTLRLARILAVLAPAGILATISTVPGAFKPRAPGAAEADAIAARLVRCADALHELAAATGRRIALAIEPEPFCALETTAETVAFFARLPARAREVIGVCFDACHIAVEWEDPHAALAALDAAGILVPKVQVSAGLEVAPGADRAALARFADDVYLHQVIADDGRRWLDLPDALADARGAGGDRATWRIHFHVPLFREQLGPFRSTQPYLRALLPALAARPAPPHLEVETYTWDVLPEEHRAEPVVDAIARELTWTRDAITARGRA